MDKDAIIESLRELIEETEVAEESERNKKLIVDYSNLRDKYVQARREIVDLRVALAPHEQYFVISKDVVVIKLTPCMRAGLKLEVMIIKREYQEVCLQISRDGAFQLAGRKE